MAHRRDSQTGRGKGCAPRSKSKTGGIRQQLASFACAKRLERNTIRSLVQKFQMEGNHVTTTPITLTLTNVLAFSLRHRGIEPRAVPLLLELGAETQFFINSKQNENMVASNCRKLEVHENGNVECFSLKEMQTIAEGSRRCFWGQ